MVQKSIGIELIDVKLLEIEVSVSLKSMFLNLNNNFRCNVLPYVTFPYDIFLILKYYFNNNRKTWYFAGLKRFLLEDFYWAAEIPKNIVQKVLSRLDSNFEKPHWKNIETEKNP